MRVCLLSHVKPELKEQPCRQLQESLTWVIISHIFSLLSTTHGSEIIV